MHINYNKQYILCFISLQKLWEAQKLDQVFSYVSSGYLYFSTIGSCGLSAVQ